MARLNKSERKQLQTEWLDIWRSAGSPRIEQPDPMRPGKMEPYALRHWGYARQTYGYASRLSIRLGNHDLTKLFCALAGERLTRIGMFYVVNIRSGCASSVMDEDCLMRQAFYVHLEAAKALRDVDALRACDLNLAIEMEAKLLAETAAQSAAPASRRWCI